ncbi:response regulator [Nannocystis bainbridge]|uniref:Response regulator n=1 Tax=Nannocystis bainbridge TaxID=2995303 RepID=A0ABT5E560_9BACT|nr:response regulator [Nannocystis bainbridge]MDC0720855.1 response regulator [Nannocystis bainbridge]
MRRILVVEDDPDVRELLGRLLQFQGFKVATAANGIEALAQLRADLMPGGAGAPLVILLDLRMPLMSGWEFRAAQLSEPTMAPIPVIIMSGSVDRDADLVAGMGADAVLRKPVLLERLMAEFRRYR